MKTISIQVPPALASAFEQADPDRKRKVEIYINAFLNDFFSNQSANERLFKTMRKASAEAKSKGFSQEELDKLLNEGE
ncbi:hypothetical protein RYH73_07880 [Olivibacter sp. CPCC 100613]|uniref:hypothetical protein n=1 Tax=Olivibacter sp. CPCC 100613 TaxID=3079931 RepID=UPI002FF90FE1